MPTILASDYNTIQAKVASVLGLSTSGWGATAIYSLPVTTNTRATAYQWNSLIEDISIINGHVYNTTSTTTAFLSTGTQLITTTAGDELGVVIEKLWQDSERYTCHPLQYILDPATSEPRLFVTTSTRTTSWGVSPIIITHGAVAAFITRLQAYYYFNLGNYLSWKPYYLPADVALNDLDLEWVRWIQWINNSPGLEFKYGRDEFIGGPNYTRVYTSGTLSITVIASKRVDEKNIDINVTYANEATSLFVVTPSVAGYSISI